MSHIAILIVEDEGVIAADLALKLEQLGYEVAGTTESGEEAVALVQRMHPDLVLMDIWLKGQMDGIEAAEAIRRGHDIPVIYLTAHSDPATLDRAKLSGPFGYILKPFEQRELATQIEMALYRHQADQQIRRQREWFRVTLSSIGDAVIATDAEGRITFLNPIAESLTGWKTEEALGQPIQSVFRIVNEQTGQPLEEPVSRVLRENRAVALANHAALVRKDGHCVPIEDSAAPITDAAGQTIGVVLVFHDVTEKRLAEEALLEGKAKLDLALQSAEMGAWELDLNEQKRYFDEQVCHCLGIDHSRFMGTAEEFYASVHPDDCQTIQTALEKAVATGMPYEEEYRAVWPDGSIHHIATRGRLLRNREGMPQRVSGMIWDVTERKQDEEALRLSEEKFSQAFAINPAAIVLSRMEDGLMLDVNETWVRLLGYSREEAIGRSARDMGIWPSAEAARRFVGELKQNGSLRDWEQEFHKKSGQVFIAQLSAQILIVRGEKLILSTLIDITQRKLSEEALRQSEERFRLALRNAPVSVAAQDLNLRYIWAYNQRTARQEDIIGKFDSDIFTSEEAAHITGIKRRVLADNMEHREQMWLNRPSGRIFLDVCWEPIRDEAGRAIGVGSATVDLTQVKLAEEALARAKDELEQRVAERTTELAHRATQLRALAGELTLAEQRERSRLAKILHDHLQQLLVAAKFRAAVLGRGGDELVKQATKEVEDLIDESIAVSRNLTAELSPPILNEAGLGAGLKWLARRMADKQGLFVNLEMEADGPLHEPLKILLFDSVRELLFNIVKHAHTSSAAVSLRQVDGRLQITVSDPGVGFDPTTMLAVGGESVGFGLFGIRERLELVGGALQIQSAPGQGSMFIISVPVDPITKIEPQSQGKLVMPQANPISRYPDPERKIRVLLADDHAVVRQGIAKMLSEEPYIDVVGAAGDGQEAVEMAAKLLPDVILMDLNMPKFNGIEATRTIHKEFPEIRIIGLSMFEETERAQAMREAGAVDYVTKSGAADALSAAVLKHGAHKKELIN